jgi:hypothetical protein
MRGIITLIAKVTLAIPGRESIGIRFIEMSDFRWRQLALPQEELRNARGNQFVVAWRPTLVPRRVPYSPQGRLSNAS